MSGGSTHEAERNEKRVESGKAKEGIRAEKGRHAGKEKCKGSEKKQRGEKSVAESEFCELGKCVFESVKEGLHAVDAAQSQLQHELASVLCAAAAECLDCSICLT